METQRADLIRIKELATSFREALEQLRGSLGRLDLNLDRFPNGCCGNVSPILGTFLTARSCGEFELIEGIRGARGIDFRSHAWLRQRELVVDITADQFEEIGDTVIVTDHSPWHDGFSQQLGCCGDHRSLGNEALTATMEQVYRAILERIERNCHARQLDMAIADAIKGETDKGPD